MAGCDGSTGQNTKSQPGNFRAQLEAHSFLKQMVTMKRAYYYLYYTLYKAWRKDYNPLLSADFRADVSLMAIKTWTILSLFAYSSLLMNTKIEITVMMGIVIGTLVIGSTLYFFTFSDKWKLYFEEFEKMSKRKNLTGRLLTWGVVIFTFINLIISINLMKDSLG